MFHFFHFMILSYLLDKLVCLRGKKVIIRWWRDWLSRNKNVSQHLWNNLSSFFEIFHLLFLFMLICVTIPMFASWFHVCNLACWSYSSWWRSVTIFLTHQYSRFVIVSHACLSRTITEFRTSIRLSSYTVLLRLILLLQSLSSNLNASTWLEHFRIILVLDQHLSIITGASWPPEWLHILLICRNGGISIRNRWLASWQHGRKVCWGMWIPLFDLLLGTQESCLSWYSGLSKMVLLLILSLILNVW